MFEGVRGVNIAGDIAIDDVSLSNGLCSGIYEQENMSLWFLTSSDTNWAVLPQKKTTGLKHRI